MEGEVAIPLSWFLGTIAGMASVIGLLGRTIFNHLVKQIEKKEADIEKMTNALNNNTRAMEGNAAAIDRMAETVSRLGS